MNKKGQALIEFIIIVPVFVMMILALFDFVRIMQTKMSLEVEVENLINDETYKLNDEIKLSKQVENEYLIYKLSQDIEIFSPVLTALMDKDYEVMVERKVYE